MVDKKMQEWIKRQEGYRKWREEGHGEKILYKPSAFSEHKKSTQKTYDELSKPTESEKLQDELEPIVHPAMERKQVKEKTLEDEKQELEDSVVQSLYQDKIRREMDKIRKEWKPWVENSVTDTHKVIYEAERRVKKDGR